jgi:hypothetical protein
LIAGITGTPSLDVDGQGFRLLDGGPPRVPLYLAPPVPLIIAIVAFLLGFLGITVIVIGGTVGIIIGGTVYFISVTALTIIVVVVALLLLLLLVYLIYRWLKKPKKPAPPPCIITTHTLVSAPDGSPDTRTTVGVNEQVELTSSIPVTWTASCGILAPTGANTALWSAPMTAGACTISAAPASGGKKCSISLRTVAPASATMKKLSDVEYTRGLAGSGFAAQAFIGPKSVSFSRLQVGEGAATAKATGYYKEVLGQDGEVHKPTAEPWPTLDNQNSGFGDLVGAPQPGDPPPFSKGSFLWRIPWFFRAAGILGAGTLIKIVKHIKKMKGRTGIETTSKGGAKRTRDPRK